MPVKSEAWTSSSACNRSQRGVWTGALALLWSPGWGCTDNFKLWLKRCYRASSHLWMQHTCSYSSWNLGWLLTAAGSSRLWDIVALTKPHISGTVCPMALFSKSSTEPLKLGWEPHHELTSNRAPECSQDIQSPQRTTHYQLHDSGATPHVDISHTESQKISQGQRFDSTTLRNSLYGHGPWKEGTIPWQGSEPGYWYMWLNNWKQAMSWLIKSQFGKCSEWFQAAKQWGTRAGGEAIRMVDAGDSGRATGGRMDNPYTQTKAGSGVIQPRAGSSAGSEVSQFYREHAYADLGLCDRVESFSLGPTRDNLSL